MIRVRYGQGENAGCHPLVSTAVPHRALLPPPLATRDFPGRPPIALRIHQVIVFLPAHHEAQCERKEQAEPETEGLALITDMQHPSSPLGCHLEQEFALLIAFEGLSCGPGWSTSPWWKGAGGSRGFSRPTRITASECQSRHENGTSRRGVVALLAAREPGGFARTYRAKLFGHNAFRLLPRTLVPDGKPHPARRFSRQSSAWSLEARDTAG